MREYSSHVHAPNLKSCAWCGEGEGQSAVEGRREREETNGGTESRALTRERARQHRTSIVDIDIIIVHRKAGHVDSCAHESWTLYRECVLSTGSRARRVLACTCDAQGDVISRIRARRNNEEFIWKIPRIFLIFSFFIFEKSRAMLSLGA